MGAGHPAATATVATVAIAFLALVLWDCKGAGALEVYDCTHLNTTYTTIDLLEPGGCPDPERDFKKPFGRLVQLVHTDTPIAVKAYRCQVSISKIVTRCGYNSITYGSQYSVFEESIFLTAPACRWAATNGTVVILERTYQVRTRQRLTASYFTHGDVDDKGACEVTSFETHGVRYTRSYEEATITIYIDVVYATADAASEYITFQGGLRTKYQPGRVDDAFLGVLVWEVDQERDCREELRSIYIGAALIRKQITMGPAGRVASMEGAIVMVTDNTTNQFAGLILRGQVRICEKWACWATQIEGVVACVLGSRQRAIKGLKTTPGADPTSTNILAQIAYSSLGTNLRMHRYFETISVDICNLDRRILHQQLAAISGGNQYALRDIYGPGHKVYVSGAAAYVAKCVRLEVNRRSFPNCTLEIPVDLNGTLGFADPISRVLVSFPTIMHCTQIMPIRWKINGNWICATPDTGPCIPPDKLNITVTGIRVGNFTAGLGSGIYSDDQILDWRIWEMMRNTHSAIMTKLGNAAVMTMTAAGHLGFPLDRKDVDDLAYRIGSMLSPMFWLLGWGWPWLCGVLLVGVIIKLILGGLVRMWILYKERGAGWWMVGALWHTGFLILRAPMVLVQEALKNIADPMPGETEHQKQAEILEEAAKNLRDRAHRLDLEKTETGRQSDLIYDERIELRHALTEQRAEMQRLTRLLRHYGIPGVPKANPGSDDDEAGSGGGPTRGPPPAPPSSPMTTRIGNGGALGLAPGVSLLTLLQEDPEPITAESVAAFLEERRRVMEDRRRKANTFPK